MRNLFKTIALSLTAMSFAFSVQSQDKNIIGLAVETESLSTLVTAVKAAGLVETLSGNGQNIYTRKSKIDFLLR